MIPDLASRKSYVALVIVVAVAAALAFITFEPVNHGYDRYLSIASEMVRTKDFVVPRWDDQIYVNKPPLFLWCVASIVAVCGHVVSIAGHLPNLIAGLLTLWLVYAFAKRELGRDGAIASVLALATMWEFAEGIRGERVDPVFALFTILTILLARSLARREFRLRDAVLCGIAMGLALLTKGPPAFGVVLLAIVPYVARSKLAVRPRASAILVAVGVMLLVTLPWPFLLVERLGWNDAWHALREAELMTRDEPFYYYLLRFPLAIAPWLLLIPAIVVALRAKGVTDERADARFFALCWLVGPLLMFQLSPIRNVRYLMPVMPPVAYLIADALLVARELAAKDPQHFTRRAFVWPCRVLRGIVPVAAVAMTIGLFARGLSWSPLFVATVVMAPLFTPRWRPDADADSVREFLLAGLLALVGKAGHDGILAMDYVRLYDSSPLVAAITQLAPNEPILLVDCETGERLAIVAAGGIIERQADTVGAAMATIDKLRPHRIVTPKDLAKELVVAASDLGGRAEQTAVLPLPKNRDLLVFEYRPAGAGGSTPH